MLDKTYMSFWDYSNIRDLHNYLADSRTLLALENTK